MSPELLKIKEKDLLFVDIETASQTSEFDENHPQFNSFQWKHRDKQTDELLPTSEVIKLYNRIAALSPVYGQIVCITVGYIADEKANIMTFSGDEFQIIKDFYEMVNNLGRTLVLWNADFDLPYIRKRAVILGVPVILRNDCGNDTDKKPWSIKGVLDLMQVWKGISYYNDSLEEVSAVLGLPSPKEDLRGSEVSKAFHGGRIADIISYCERDVVSTLNIFRKFTLQPVIDEIIVKEYKPQKPLPLLERIKNKGVIDDEDRKILDNFKGDKNKLDNILNSVL